ncbi:DNA mismatch repair protein, partial [Chytridiales sp. JEL 0842]
MVKITTSDTRSGAALSSDDLEMDDADEPEETFAKPTRIQTVDMVVESESQSSNNPFAINERDIVDVCLTSILELRKEVGENSHQGMVNLFKGHTFVGLIDTKQALVQYETKLFIIDFPEISSDLFYQLSLAGFSNFGFIHLSKPISITEMLALAVEELDHSIAQTLQEGVTDIVETFSDTIFSRRDMLLEYFSIKIDENGFLMSLPVLLREYRPNLDKLPDFLLRMAVEVNWESEKECFEGVCRELGIFYSCEAPFIDEDSLEPLSQEDTNQQKSEMAQYKWTVEHVIFK